MKILNLYAGIGGNRKLWEGHEIIAVENKPKIAEIYQDFFPNDKVVVADAHQYLLDHYQEFDFIWSSPPCPSHSTFRKYFSMGAGAKAIYPDMKLYEEILFLQGYFKGDWVVENVKSWYKPLIEPQIIQRHYFWSNKQIPDKEFLRDGITAVNGYHKEKTHTQNNRLGQQMKIVIPNSISKSKKNLLLRNCVLPELGKHILDNLLTPNRE